MFTGLIFFPFLLQIVVICIDEYYFHLQRGLPRWERIGHPIDTLSVLSCMLYALWVPFSEVTFYGFLALAGVSCLLVTKDEFVHKHHCPAAEHWLHALLFVNHPIMLASVCAMWAVAQGAWVPGWLTWIDDRSLVNLFLGIQAVGIGLFLAYQVIYWNFIWDEKAPKRK
jgi:hypothetical protein